MSAFDTIVVGAGVNGLVCATLLAKSGQRVLLLEQGQQAGGLAAPRMFADGFSAPVAHHATSFQAPVAEALGLEAHGLRWAASPASISSLSGNGRVVTVTGPDVTGVGDDDVRAWKTLAAQLDRFSEALAPFWLKTMPRIASGGLRELGTFGSLAWKLRRLGRDEFREFLRVFALPMRDLADETLDNEALKALLAWDGLIGSRMAPRSPNNAVPMLLYRRSGRAVTSPGNLLAALNAAAAQAGVTMRTGAPVERLRIESDAKGQRVTGVTLAGGEPVDAMLVVSSLDPKSTFFGLAGAPQLEIGFTNRIQRIRSRGLVAKVHLALDGLPVFAGLDSPRGRLLDAPDLDAIEFAFDASKYGEVPGRPVMEFCLPSLEDPSLAPQGQHVLSAHVMYITAERKGGWDDEARAALLDTVLGRLEALSPGIRRLVLASELLLPGDLEREHGLAGGHWHHGEFALDQMLMMRPTYEAAQYRTPLEGLWLCGAGCHPAGDLTGAAGHNAARELLRQGALK
jgi:phytoene dehydrogenase-like protein